MSAAASSTKEDREHEDLREWTRKIVDAFPPLTPEQKLVIRRVMGGGGQS